MYKNKKKTDLINEQPEFPTGPSSRPTQMYTYYI